MLLFTSRSRRRPRFERLSRRIAIASLALIGCLAAAVPAQAQDVAGGALLVASDKLKDPNFSRVVVLVLRHDEQGTVGVVVNRPTNLVPTAAFPELAAGMGNYDGRLYRGGPVAPARVLFLVRGLAAATVNGPEVVEKVFLSADPESLADMTRLAAGTDDLRLYAGHAEWTQGQLAEEIKAGGWKVVPATAELVFSEDPGALWAQLSQQTASGVVAQTAPAKTQAFAAERERGILSRSALR
jgi:putative transcriptional regulator